MSAVGEIPGYYYDKEKKKYFKIQPRSAAPASAAYSSHDVKRRKLKDEQDAAAAIIVGQQKNRIQRCRLLESPLAGGFLAREQSYGSQNIDAASIYAGGLMNRGSIGWRHVNQGEGCSHLWAIKSQLNISPGMIDIHSACNDLLSSVCVNADKFYRRPYHPQFKGNEGRYLSGIRRPTLAPEVCVVNPSDVNRNYFGRPGMVTSLSLNQHSNQIAMTWLAGAVSAGIMVKSSLLTIHEEDQDRPVDILTGPGYGYVGPGSEIDVLSSGAAPPQSPYSFAFGTSRGVMIMEKSSYNTKVVNKNSEDIPKDIFAVEFLSDNHSVLLAGGRNGFLNITDLRVPISGRDTDMIIHPSSVIHIKQLDMHRIIVAGLNSTLCQYDLRFRKRLDFTTLNSNHRRFSELVNSYITRPTLQYPEYHNTATIHVGFDVDLESGVVAACQEHDLGHRPIQLFSLHGGHILPSPRLSELSNTKDTWKLWDTDTDNTPWRSARFLQDTESKFKSLYVGQKYLTRFSWVPQEPDIDKLPVEKGDVAQSLLNKGKIYGIWDSLP